MKKYDVIIPKLIDVDAMLNEHKPTAKLKKDKLIYIISLIYPIGLNNNENWYQNEWVLLNAQTLKKIISDYKRYLDYLIDTAGLLECDEVYSPNGRSKGYRFVNRHYNTMPPKRITLTDKTLLDAIERSWKADNFGSDYVKASLPYLYKWFNEKLTVKLPDGDSIQARAINDQNYRLSVDKFGKRLHTPLTRLPKEHRQHLRYDEKKLVEIDLRSSQPYLSIALLLEQAFKQYPDLKARFDGSSTTSDRMHSIFAMKKCVGLLDFIGDVTTKDIYSVIGEAFEQEYGFGLGDRNGYKDLIMEVLFSSNGYSTKGKKLITKMYPFVDEVFRSLKRTNHKALAKQLQQLESKLILRNICKRIGQENKDIPIFTIHDSILTTGEHVETVKQVMIEVLTDAVGFAPTLK